MPSYVERLREKANRLRRELEELNARMESLNVPDRLSPEAIATMSPSEFKRIKALMDRRRNLFYRSMDVAVRLNRIEDELRRLGEGG